MEKLGANFQTSFQLKHDISTIAPLSHVVHRGTGDTSEGSVPSHFTQWGIVMVTNIPGQAATINKYMPLEYMVSIAVTFLPSKSLTKTNSGVKE